MAIIIYLSCCVPVCILTLPIQSRCRGCPRGVLVKAMDCGIVVREFVLQSRYYVHFRANTLGKGMNPLKLRLKFDLVSYPARAEGLGK